VLQGGAVQGGRHLKVVSVVQSVVGCCSVLQCVAACGRVVQGGAGWTTYESRLCNAECCRVV